MVHGACVCYLVRWRPLQEHRSLFHGLLMFEARTFTRRTFGLVIGQAVLGDTNG